MLRRFLFPVVEVTGFEPATFASRTQRSTKLSHTSKKSVSENNNNYYNTESGKINRNFQIFFLICGVMIKI